jgi:hypothetical protein
MPEQTEAELRAERDFERAQLRRAGRVCLRLLAVLGLLAILFAVRIVPDLTGLSGTAAVARIRHYGLDPEVEEVHRGDPGDVPTGSVEAHPPSAWRPVWRHTPVTVSVVVGSLRVRVPEVKGESLSAAEYLFQEAGVTLDERTLETTKNPHARRVVSTDPPAGSLVPRDTAIRMAWSEPSDATYAGRHTADVFAFHGPMMCLRCHAESFCADCHVKHAPKNLYNGPRL